MPPGNLTAHLDLVTAATGPTGGAVRIEWFYAAWDVEAR